MDMAVIESETSSVEFGKVMMSFLRNRYIIFFLPLKRKKCCSHDRNVNSNYCGRNL